MTPDKIFELIWSGDYTTTGDDVDWKIYADEYEKIIHLVYKYSDSKTDWKNNFIFRFNYYLRDNVKMLVASGWAEAYHSARGVILDALFEEFEKYDEKYKVEIDGHSYGGAVALICAEDINFTYGIKPDVVTFGAPKPFFGRKTVKYVKSCCGTIRQYIHVNDCVPLMPPFFGYHHCNKVRLGKICNPICLFNPKKWHLIYDKPELYGIRI